MRAMSYLFLLPGAGVEWPFNSARDICHYQRGSLNATTIHDDVHVYYPA
jgi:hypothetical protein